LRRLPWLTLAVAVVTGVMLVVQETVPGTLGHLERTPAAWHGDWWRWVTPMLVQDGHWAGGISNLVGLLLLGTAAEQVVRRPGWLGFYVGGGLVGQVFGHYWQPVGGGNSVANCGLAALCVAVALHRRGDVPPIVLAAPAYWCGALAAIIWVPLVFVGVGLGVLVSGPLVRRAWTRWLVAGQAVLVTAALLAGTDLHGGGLAVMLVVAGVLLSADPAAERLCIPPGPGEVGA
jgi:membrane associated rhomboid family serine protease